MVGTQLSARPALTLENVKSGGAGKLQIEDEAKDSEIVLNTAEEVNALRWASAIRSGRIHWLNLPRRELRRELDSLAADLTGNISLRLGEGKAVPVRLSGRRRRIAVDALRWVVAHDDFDPIAKQMLIQIREHDRAA
jgi:hypothetical protein